MKQIIESYINHSRRPLWTDTISLHPERRPGIEGVFLTALVQLGAFFYDGNIIIEFPFVPRPLYIDYAKINLYSYIDIYTIVY